MLLKFNCFVIVLNWNEVLILSFIEICIVIKCFNDKSCQSLMPTVSSDNWKCLGKHLLTKFKNLFANLRFGLNYLKPKLLELSYQVFDCSCSEHWKLWFFEWLGLMCFAVVIFVLWSWANSRKQVEFKIDIRYNL